MGSLGREVGVRIGNVSSCSTTKSWDKTLIFGIWFPNSHELFLRVLFFLGKRAEIPLSATFIHSKQHRMWTRVNTGCPKKNAPTKQTKMAKHGRLVNIPKWSKGVRNGEPRCFWQFGTLLGPSRHFWAISDKNQFVAPWGQSWVRRRCFWAKTNFCLKLFKRVQMGPKGSQMIQNI